MGYLSTVPTEQAMHDQNVSSSVYGSAYAGRPIPKYEMSEEEMPARVSGLHHTSTV